MQLCHSPHLHASFDQRGAMHTFIPHAMTYQMLPQEVASHAAKMLTPLCHMCTAETA